MDVEEDDLLPGLAVVVDGETSLLGLLERVQENSEVHFLPAIGEGEFCRPDVLPLMRLTWVAKGDILKLRGGRAAFMQPLRCDSHPPAFLLPMYLLYLDDSGFIDSRNDKHFVLAGIAVSSDKYSGFRIHLSS